MPDDLRGLVHEMIRPEGVLTALDIHRIVCDIMAASLGQLPATLLASDHHAAVDQPQLQRGLSVASTASTASTATQTDLEAGVGVDSPGADGELALLIAEKTQGLCALADTEISAATAQVLKKGLAEIESLVMQLQGGTLAL